MTSARRTVIASPRDMPHHDSSARVQPLRASGTMGRVTDMVDSAARVTRVRRGDLVIFDLDGTLTDSAEGIVASFRHALAAIGAPVPEGDLVSRIVGPPMRHTLE